MASLSNLLDDVRNAAALIQARRDVDSADGKSAIALQKSLVNSVASKIARMSSLTPNEAKQLLDATKASGFDAMGKHVVVSAIDSKLETELDGETHVTPSSKNMLLVNAPCWVTESFMKALRGKGTINVKLAIAAEYLTNNLQCDHPHEQTLKHWLTLTILCHFEVWPKYRLVYDYLQIFKEEVIATRKN
jgi:hypothetical protein